MYPEDKITFTHKQPIDDNDGRRDDRDACGGGGGGGGQRGVGGHSGLADAVDEGKMSERACVSRGRGVSFISVRSFLCVGAGGGQGRGPRHAAANRRHGHIEGYRAREQCCHGGGERGRIPRGRERCLPRCVLRRRQREEEKERDRSMKFSCLLHCSSLLCSSHPFPSCLSSCIPAWDMVVPLMELHERARVRSHYRFDK